MSDVLDDNKKATSSLDTMSNENILVSRYDRFLGHVIDLLCVLPFFIAYVFFMENKFGVIKESEFFDQPIAAALYIFFMFGLEALFSKTPGKYFLKTVVVDINGDKPKRLSILVRNMCRLIPFDALTFISDKRGWHDTISKTYVVYSK